MSLYDKSSLLQVPSLYKDGTLVSTIPEDRSGDFTVSRGSNLAATRIGPDGYIKKGYENLLLQSNSFDTTWVNYLTTETSGQTGYDGSSDAWLLTKSGANGNIYQNKSSSGVQTISVYAKKNTNSWLQIYAVGSPNVRAYYDLENGVLGGYVFNAIEREIEDVGNGWYRCSVTFNSSLNSVRLYPSDGNNDESGTSGSIYIQDAQLNQGLVAYPYLETTNAPAQGGLLENTPRLDWSNGVPSVLVEEGRTNLITSSEYFGTGFTSNQTTITSNTHISPEGIQNASTIADTVTNDVLELYYRPQFTSGETYTFSIFIKKDNETTRFPEFYFRIYNGGTSQEIAVQINTQTGYKVDRYVNGGSVSSDVIDFSDNYWKLVITGTDPNDGNDQFRIYIRPAASNTLGGVLSNLITGSIVVYGIQVEQASTSTSYIPTYGTTQTRSSEVISDDFNIPTTATIYNSFYSDVAETVFVLDQVFDVVEGLNKVAIAFSPTAVKISVGGSIVANATGTYDTTSLTNIQLGSNNGTDYSNAPISGFYVFPEFLTDEELNSLTD